jgi:chromosomal replication initiation ATPase DnaA
MRTPEPPFESIAGAAGADTSQRFVAALAEGIGVVAARTWLKDTSLEAVDGEWVLLTPTRFSADWIRGHFDQALRQVAAAVGLTAPPQVRARVSPALPR